jgi:hypothetical protein
MAGVSKDTILGSGLMVFVVPLTILNSLSGIIGGIWLAFTHNLGIVLLGLLYMFISSSVLAWILMPGLGLGLLSASLLSKPKMMFLGSLTSVAGWVYDLLVVTASVVVVFATLANHFNGGNRIAFMLWGYAVALAPWAYMASREPDDGDFNATLTLTFFLSLGMTSSLVGGFISHNVFWLIAPYVVCLGIFLLIMTFLSFWYFPKLARAEHNDSQLLFPEPKPSTKHHTTHKSDDDKLEDWDNIK